MDWVFDNWKPVDLYSKGDVMKNVEPLAVEKGKEESVKLAAGEDTKIILPSDKDKKDISVSFEPAKKIVSNDDELTAPAEKGTKVGEAEMTIKEDKLGYIEGTKGEEVPAVTNTTVEKANIFVLSGRSVSSFFNNMYHKVFQ